MKLSVVICVYNEELNIKPLVSELFNSLQGIEFEIIYVDDGSSDNTVTEIKSINSKNITLIELKRNFGQSSALAAGIDIATGEYIATMDGDMQNDPADLADMLKLAEDENWDMVAGNRSNRKDGFILRKFPSAIANWIIRRSTGLKIKDFGCTIRIFKSEIAKNLGLYGEMHRFIPVLAYLQGASITQVDVKHHPRTKGKSKYGINRTFKVLPDLLLTLFFKRYMQKPMQLFGGMGLLLLFIGVALNFYLLVLKILGNDIWGKPLLILAVITLLGGIQLITIGIVVEIQMRTYYESQNKKQYSIRQISKGEK
ncbi:MAG: glycosyltransferase family 2 protein [Bacteroidales bacterium]|nr:glycosyltransferase family 2 protein [Bacteroidales bacterium]